MQYLNDLECPITLENDNKLVTLDWLLNYAVSLEFQDQGNLNLCQWAACMLARLFHCHSLSAADRYNKPAVQVPSRPVQLSKKQALHTDSE